MAAVAARRWRRGVRQGDGTPPWSATTYLPDGGLYFGGFRRIAIGKVNRR
jgi:hypothetical protein